MEADRQTNGEPRQSLAPSPTQYRILHLAACGLTDKEIANRLGIRYRTVRTHLERLSLTVVDDTPDGHDDVHVRPPQPDVGQDPAERPDHQLRRGRGRQPDERDRLRRHHHVHVQLTQRAHGHQGPIRRDDLPGLRRRLPRDERGLPPDEPVLQLRQSRQRHAHGAALLHDRPGGERHHVHVRRRELFDLVDHQEQRRHDHRFAELLLRRPRKPSLADDQRRASTTRLPVAGSSPA